MFSVLISCFKDVILMITPRAGRESAAEELNQHSEPQSVSEHTRRTFSHMNKSANLVEL